MSFMLLLSLAVAMVAREHDVISVFIPNADPQPLVASIIAQVWPMCYYDHYTD